MKELRIKDEYTVVLRDMETGEVVDTFKSCILPEPEVEGQMTWEEVEKENEVD